MSCWSRPIAAYLWSGCLDTVTPYRPAAAAFAQLGPPKAFVTDPTGTHQTVPTFPPGTVNAFLDRFVAGNTTAATTAPFVAAANDPYFGYDLDGSIPPHVETGTCTTSEPTPTTTPVATTPVAIPTFTG